MAKPNVIGASRGVGLNLSRRLFAVSAVVPLYSINTVKPAVRDRTGRTSWPWVRALLHSVHDQPDAASVHAQFDRVLDALTDKLPTVAAHLEDSRADVLAFTAFTAFPKEVWRQIWSKTPPNG